MPLICIGPVCIPISALLPVLAYLARPVWKRLPEPTQQLLIGYWQAFSEWMQANLWDRVGWKAKPAPAAKGATAEMAAGAGDLASIADELRSRTGSVAGLHSLDDWAAAKLVSASMPVIVDFTAAWCGPCQKIKPFFAELAAAHEEALFVTVDVDELEQVSEEAQVRAMPTFQVRVAPQGRPRRLPQFLSLPPRCCSLTLPSRNRHSKRVLWLPRTSSFGFWRGARVDRQRLLRCPVAYRKGALAPVTFRRLPTASATRRCTGMVCWWRRSRVRGWRPSKQWWTR